VRLSPITSNALNALLSSEQTLPKLPSDVYLGHICSLNTSAFSTLEVADDKFAI